MSTFGDSDSSEGYDTGQLLYAASRGKDKLVTKLLSKGLNVNSVDYDGRTPAHVAAAGGHMDTLNLLLSHGANFQVEDRWGGTPMDDALNGGDQTVIQFLNDLGIKKGNGKGSRSSKKVVSQKDVSPQVDTTRNIVDKISPVASFLFACADGDVAAVNDLLNRPGNAGVNINVPDYDKRSGLHLAASEGHLELVEFLIEKGANVNAMDRWGHTPLSDSERSGHVKVSNFLRKNGGIVTAGNTDPVGNAVDGQSIPTTHDILVALQKRGEAERWAVADSEINLENRPFAKGAAGEIFRAKWRGLDCVAKSWLTATPQMMIDLGNEISLLSTLRHPHLIMFLGACFMHQPPILLMEYCGGGTLERRLIDGAHKHKLSKSEKTRYSYELALGMNFLHSCSTPVVHRDLKPSNILLTNDGRVKITDFGLSKFIPSKNKNMNDTFAMTGETGSYRFMAPEVFRHEAYNLKVDVYSFALILFWIYSGVRPLVNFKNPVEAVRAAALKNVRPPLEIVPNTLIRSLLSKAWASNPKDRPTFEEIVDYLESHNLIPQTTKPDKKDSKCLMM